MPSEKRARQRAQREAKRAQEQKAAKKKALFRRVGFIALGAVVVVGSAWLILKPSSTPTTTTTTQPSTSTTMPNTPSTTSTTAANSTYAAAQTAANAKAVAAGCPANPTTRANTLSWNNQPALTIDTNKTYIATVKTTAGTFTITLDAKQAPTTVNNFVFLARQGFYHCVNFHRVIPDFVVQGGDPTGTGSGGPGYAVSPDEYPKAAANRALQYPIGSVAMANSGAGTNGSQFFIVTGVNGEGLAPQFTLFDQVGSGMDTVNTISGYGTPQGTPPNVIERMLSVTIAER